jgi:hypothetical protein
MRAAWEKMKPALESGMVLTVEIKQENRSSDQNRLIHSIISQISSQAKHLGSTWDVEDFKRLLVWQWAKEIGGSPSKIVPSLDGEGFVQLGLQTRKFTKQQASEFTEWLMAWCAENGVEIHE